MGKRLSPSIGLCYEANRLDLCPSKKKEIRLEAISKEWIRVQGKARGGKKRSIHGSM